MSLAHRERFASPGRPLNQYAVFRGAIMRLFLAADRTSLIPAPSSYYAPLAPLTVLQQQHEDHRNYVGRLARSLCGGRHPRRRELGGRYRRGVGNLEK